MTSEIPVTQARDELADLVSRVAYGRERIILTRHSKPVACLVSPEDLARLEAAEREGPDAYPAPASASAHAPASPPQRPGAPGLMPVAAEYRAPGGRGHGSPAQPG
ncbi:MAG TPA: type II toxin-antitoxin system Phd/YefM family antitoxin [Streptosporangiaceae bacterium]|nr:type II toxin-antitoxin system Phd/YefM family antitoxin [Streptosporangiaceae bacterium]